LVRLDVRRDDRREYNGARCPSDLCRSRRDDDPYPRQRPGEDPAAARPIRQYADFSSHDAWGTDHFGFLYQGNLEAFCAELGGKGVTFPVELKRGVNGSLLRYGAAPDGVASN
jgi:hypothetical protein